MNSLRGPLGAEGRGGARVPISVVWVGATQTGRIVRAGSVPAQRSKGKGKDPVGTSGMGGRDVGRRDTDRSNCAGTEPARPEEQGQRPGGDERYGWS